MTRKPSPALVISILALFVALGGTSYAAVKLNGKNIKRGTVPGTALKKNTLTGAQIKESRIGKVPSAVVAERADFATNATRLGGIAPEALVQGDANVITRNATIETSTTGTILQIPGLARLEGVCSGADELAVKFVSEAEDVSARILVTPTGTTITSSGGTFDAGTGVTMSANPSQKIQMSVWRAATPDVAYEIDGASVICKASAVAIGHG